ncbi:hypothetical protein GQ44DRAFT_281055 [Phaeosphaeriaceae sp. PMI808]|nr:hypothetical protein GQ44DRAFT_281055 [Phaeosphaeriaceae sp. PMI808]
MVLNYWWRRHGALSMCGTISFAVKPPNARSQRNFSRIPGFMLLSPTKLTQQHSLRHITDPGHRRYQSSPHRTYIAPFTAHCFVTNMSDLSIIRENSSTYSFQTDSDLLPTLFLVQDFGWPKTSPRYRGDHTHESNPDWEHDPMGCAKAKEGAMKKMEVSYALYLANMSHPPTTKKSRATKDKDGWTKFVMPWKWTARREVAAL